jgi:NAD(P)-dependent dehydrogenase (short-subunit alcohol dehydrogenase family)
MTDLAQHVALVTGSNRGLGKKLVEELLARGIKRVYAASRKPGPAWGDPRVVPITLDVTDPKSTLAAAERASDVTLLVNNAGVFSAGPVLGATDAQLRGDMEVNYYGLLNTIRAFVPVLVGKRDATIANVLSVVSLANITTFGGYSTTKAAAWSLTQTLRNELREKGIRIVAVFPGMIDTEMVAAYDAPKASTAEVTNGILDGIVAGTNDIAPDSASSGAFATYLKDPQGLIAHFRE